jgi:hypothetical protein
MCMSEPARDLPAEQPRLLAGAVDDARRGVITHLTIDWQRVAAIVPESVIQDAAEADTAMDEPGESIALEDLEAEFGL